MLMVETTVSQALSKIIQRQSAISASIVLVIWQGFLFEWEQYILSISQLNHVSSTSVTASYCPLSLYSSMVNQCFQKTHTHTHKGGVVCTTFAVSPIPLPPSSCAHSANLGDVIGGFSVPMKVKVCLGNNLKARQKRVKQGWRDSWPEFS